MNWRHSIYTLTLSSLFFSFYYWLWREDPKKRPVFVHSSFHKSEVKKKGTSELNRRLTAWPYRAWLVVLNYLRISSSIPATISHRVARPLSRVCEAHERATHQTRTGIKEFDQNWSLSFLNRSRFCFRSSMSSFLPIYVCGMGKRIHT